MVLTRGDTGAYTFRRLDSSGNPILETPTALYFTVKKSFNQRSSVLQKTLSDMTMDGEGYWHFVLEPDDTATLDYGTYVYDIEVTSGDYIKTIAKGELILGEESTWENNK